VNVAKRLSKHLKKKAGAQEIKEVCKGLTKWNDYLNRKTDSELTDQKGGLPTKKIELAKKEKK